MICDRHSIRSLADESMRMKAYPDPRFPPSLYYRFLRKLAESCHPKLSVELGLCGGGGSLHMALGNPEGIVVGIDITNDYPLQIEHIVMTCMNFRFHQMDSADPVAIALIHQMYDKTVDILFIDTTHTYERTMMEFHAWESYLSVDAIVVLDDLFRYGMDRAFRELPGEKIQLDMLHDSSGFGVVLL